eukprot:3175249-Rhodomonas_salina.2
MSWYKRTRASVPADSARKQCSTAGQQYSTGHARYTRTGTTMLRYAATRAVLRPDLERYEHRVAHVQPPLYTVSRYPPSVPYLTAHISSAHPIPKPSTIPLLSAAYRSIAPYLSAVPSHSRHEACCTSAYTLGQYRTWRRGRIGG